MGTLYGEATTVVFDDATGAANPVDAMHGLPTDAAAGAFVALSSPPSATNAGSDTALPFASAVRHLLIQNNTSAAVYCDCDVAATQGSFEIYPNGQTALLDVPCAVLHLYTAAAQTINGSAAGGIVVKGWA